MINVNEVFYDKNNIEIISLPTTVDSFQLAPRGGLSQASHNLQISMDLQKGCHGFEGCCL
jgi:hypothetical protein